jgi:hypothetical protein
METTTNTPPPAPTTPEPRPPLKEITTALMATLANPASTHDRLHQQTALLHTLLCTIIKHQSEPEIARGCEVTHEWLELALRVQKQCVDTLKASAAIDYMQSLAPRTLPPTPLLENDERTQ